VRLEKKREALVDNDPSIFPAEYYAEDNNLDKGIILIRATLEEMKKINQLGIDLNKNEGFLFNTRVELEDLMAKKAKLESNRKTRKPMNPFKVFRNYRAARSLHEKSKSLYLQTKCMAENTQRDAASSRVVPSTRRTVDKSNLVVSIPSSTFTNGSTSGPGIKVESQSCFPRTLWSRRSTTQGTP